jgi:hypothetical protein
LALWVFRPKNFFQLIHVLPRNQFRHTPALIATSSPLVPARNASAMIQIASQSLGESGNHDLPATE